MTRSWVRVTLPEANAVVGEPTGPAALRVPLERGGEVVGQSSCGPKDGGYATDDRELLATLAGQAATAIANVASSPRSSPSRLDELRALPGPDRRGAGRRAAPDRARHARRRPAARRRADREAPAGPQPARPRRDADRRRAGSTSAGRRRRPARRPARARPRHPPAGAVRPRASWSAIEARADRMPLASGGDAGRRRAARAAVRRRRRGRRLLRGLRGAHQRREARRRAHHAGVDLSHDGRRLSVLVHDDGSGWRTSTATARPVGTG